MSEERHQGVESEKLTRIEGQVDAIYQVLYTGNGQKPLLSRIARLEMALTIIAFVAGAGFIGALEQMIAALTN